MYNTITTEEMENVLVRLKQYYYEHGDKAGKWFAWQEMREDATRCIPAIRQPDIGELIHNLLLINQSFSHFYTSASSKTMKDVFKFFDSQVIAELLEPGAPAVGTPHVNVGNTESGGAFSQKHVCCSYVKVDALTLIWRGYM